jgi:hypothetical protein
LPAVYRQIFETIAKATAPALELNLRDPVRLSKLSRIYALTPVKALSMLLSMGNPVGLVSGLVNLFLAKPANAKNLMQV